MLGGILFIVIVWFIPLLIWYLIQGKKEFNLNPFCNISSKEQMMSRRMFYGAIMIGFLFILLVIFY